MTLQLHRVMQTYQGSDGEATRALYAELQQRGPVGVIAVNLFRAQKNSARAKVYRGGVRDASVQRICAFVAHVLGLQATNPETPGPKDG